jgi:hypothetical protein
LLVKIFPANNPVSASLFCAVHGLVGAGKQLVNGGLVPVVFHGRNTDADACANQPDFRFDRVSGRKPL